MGASSVTSDRSVTPQDYWTPEACVTLVLCVTVAPRLLDQQMALLERFARPAVTALKVCSLIRAFNLDIMFLFPAVKPGWAINYQIL